VVWQNTNWQNGDSKGTFKDDVTPAGIVKGLQMGMEKKKKK